jgi:hypothetical protein
MKTDIKDSYSNNKVRITLERWQYSSTGTIEWNIWIFTRCHCEGETLSGMDFDNGRSARSVFNGLVKGYSPSF